MRIWNVGTNKLVKSWPNAIPTSNDFFASSTLARMSWQPKNGATLAIPFGNTIKLFQRGTWNETSSLTDPAIKKPFSIVSYSPCGRILIATSGDGFWSLFKVASRYELISSERNLRNTVVTGLDWKPNDGTVKSLAFCNFEGDLGIVTIKLSDEETHPADDLVNSILKNVV